MTRVILLTDVGGTRTRVKIMSADLEILPDTKVIATHEENISTKKGLLDFINGLLSEYKLKNKLHAAVLCFAGPVNRQANVIMTNWHAPREIAFAELTRIGLPANNTIIVNDMECAAHALIDKQREPHRSSLNVLPLHQVSRDEPAEHKNLLLLMPGTGLGVAAVICTPQHHSPAEPIIISSEIQHSVIPVLDSEHGALMSEMKKLSGKDNLSWEDCISGRGLENIYTALVRLDALKNNTELPRKELTANEIAELAVLQTDINCQTSLDLYYRCAGTLAQIAALMFKPFGGIYLMGNSTRKNFSFIPQSSFLPALQNNPIQAALLGKFPVYLITDDLNLDGAARIANHHLQETIQTSLFA